MIDGEGGRASAAESVKIFCCSGVKLSQRDLEMMISAGMYMILVSEKVFDTSMSGPEGTGPGEFSAASTAPFCSAIIEFGICHGGRLRAERL